LPIELAVFTSASEAALTAPPAMVSAPLQVLAVLLSVSVPPPILLHGPVPVMTLVMVVGAPPSRLMAPPLTVMLTLRLPNCWLWPGEVVSLMRRVPPSKTTLVRIVLSPSRLV
jgi:hypothetical protein